MVLRHPANQSGRARAMVRVLRFQMAARVLQRPLIVPYGGRSRFIANLDDGPSRRAAYFPVPDWAEMNAWQRHLGAGDLFVDVGASVGLYSVIAAELGCEVICVEPVARSLKQLEANLALNEYNAVVLAAALSDVEGNGVVWGPDASRQHILFGEIPSMEVTQTRLTTLDEVLQGRYAAGVKVDVEGAERRVLLGGIKALSDQRIGLLQVEWNTQSVINYNESRDSVATLLTAVGYELCRPAPDGGLEVVSDIAPGSDMFARPRL
jgi:FkbM family methyltransferase